MGLWAKDDNPELTSPEELRSGPGLPVTEFSNGGAPG